MGRDDGFIRIHCAGDKAGRLERWMETTEKGWQDDVKALINDGWTIIDVVSTSGRVFYKRGQKIEK